MGVEGGLRLRLFDKVFRDLGLALGWTQGLRLAQNPLALRNISREDQYRAIVYWELASGGKLVGPWSSAPRARYDMFITVPLGTCPKGPTNHLLSQNLY